jgi:hypothetical protein
MALEHLSLFGSVSTASAPEYVEAVGHTVLGGAYASATNARNYVYSYAGTTGSYDGASPRLSKLRSSSGFVQQGNSPASYSYSTESEGQGSTSSGSASGSYISPFEYTLSGITTYTDGNATYTRGSAGIQSNTSSYSYTHGISGSTSVGRSVNGVASTFFYRAGRNRAGSLTGESPLSTISYVNGYDNADGQTGASGNTITGITVRAGGNYRSENGSSYTTSDTATGTYLEGASATTYYTDTQYSSGSSFPLNTTTSYTYNNTTANSTDYTYNQTTATTTVEVVATSLSTRTYGSYKYPTATTTFTVFTASDTTVSASKTTIIYGTAAEIIEVTRDTLSSHSSEGAAATIPSRQVVTVSAYGPAGIATASAVGLFNSAISALGQSFSFDKDARPAATELVISPGSGSTLSVTRTVNGDSSAAVGSTLTTTRLTSTHTYYRTTYSESQVSFITTSANYYPETTTQSTRDETQYGQSTSTDTYLNRSSFILETHGLSSVSSTRTSFFFDGSSIQSYEAPYTYFSTVSSTARTLIAMDSRYAKTVKVPHFPFSIWSKHTIVNNFGNAAILTVKERVFPSELAFAYHTSDRQARHLPPSLTTAAVTTIDEPPGTTTTNSGSGLLAIGNLRKDISLLPSSSTFGHSDTYLTFSQEGNVGTIRLGASTRLYSLSPGNTAELLKTIDSQQDYGLPFAGGGETIDAQAGFFSAVGPLQFTLGSVETTLSNQEYFTSLLESHSLYLVSADRIATARPALTDAYVVTALIPDNYVPYYPY